MIPDPLKEAQEEIARLRVDAAIGQLVRRKLTSGNAVPVERCVIRADEVDAITIGPFNSADELFSALGETK